MYSLRLRISLLILLVYVCHGITTANATTTNTSPTPTTTDTTTSSTTTTTTEPPTMQTSTATLNSIEKSSTSTQENSTSGISTSSSSSYSSTTDGLNISPSASESSSANTASISMDTASVAVNTTVSTITETIDSSTTDPTSLTTNITTLPGTTLPTVNVTPTSASTQAPAQNSTNSTLSTDATSPTSTNTPSTDEPSSTFPSSDTLPPTKPSDMIPTTSASTVITSPVSAISSSISTAPIESTSSIPPTSVTTTTTTVLATMSTHGTTPTTTTTAPTESNPSSILSTSSATTVTVLTMTTTNVTTPIPTTTSTTSINSTSSSIPPTSVATTVTVPTTTSTNATTPTPTTTTTDVDSCNNVTCENAGSCIPHDASNYTCKCVLGFDGRHCENNIDDCVAITCQNGGTCKDNVNNYTCQCVPGYDGRLCENNIDNCVNITCKNGGTCKDDVNNFTCQCVPGYDGRLCENDTDDCVAITCLNGGTCKDGLNNYTCQCVPGYDGRLCAHDIDDCVAITCLNGGTCIDGLNNYTCQCVPGYDGRLCDHDIDNCVNITCQNGGTCKDGLNNYTCQCVTGWEGWNCEINIDECKRGTHNCSKYANCTDNNGSYSCSCRSGFLGNGSDCVDIDECAQNNGTCTYGTCVNVLGTYRCFCQDGWTGKNCTEDIDECKTGNQCGSNATCNNTDGGFTCLCQSGYRGDGYECVFEVLISVPSSLPRRYGDDNVYGPFVIKDGLAYFGRLYNTFYVSVNGYITLGQALSRNYPPTGSWPTMPVIAPLWADVQMGPDQNPSSFIEIADSVINETVLNAISRAANMSVTKAIAVTWRKAVPYPYNMNFKYETADFQVIVGTDNKQTFVMYNYDQKIFNWTKSFGRRVAIGYSMENFGGQVQFNTNDFTSVNLQSNIGVNGRWVFKIYSSAADSKLKCYNEIRSIQIKDLETFRAVSEPCPCSYAQAIRDRRYTQLTYYGIYKFESRFQQIRFNSSLRQHCHYNRFGSLITGFRDGGYLDIKNNVIFEALQKACCTNSPSGCQNFFYNVHPSDTCIRYRPPSWAPAWGDPHIKTLDGAEYTFNGRGEYVLVKSESSFEVQVRTDNIDSNTDASIFVGLALRNGPGKDIMSIVLDTSNKEANIYINEQHNSTFNATNPLDIFANGFEVHSDVNTTGILYIDLESQLSLKITIGDILDIVATMPKSNNTLGLLGNNDGDNENDYILRHGTRLNSNATEENLFQFGTSWRIEEYESLFNGTYGLNPFGFYNNDAIKPSQFISDLLKNETKIVELFKQCPNVNYTQAKAICNNNTACLVDTAATCNSSFGNNTLNTDAVETEAAKQLKNSPPIMTITGNNGTNIVHFIYGQDFELTLNVTDDKDLNVSATLDTNGKFERESNRFMMKTEFVKTLRDQAIYLNFAASDSLGASTTIQPIIYFCGCNDSNQCNYEFILEEGKVSDSFYRAKCVCPAGLGVTDQYCDKAVSECENCYNDSCTNGTCSPCPHGLSGDGIKCNDVNECNSDVKLCSQKCENTLGSYTCSCFNGYHYILYQYKNNTICEDINECILQMDNCSASQVCINTNGSFKCECRPGYMNNNGMCSKERYSSVFGGKLSFTVIEKFSTDNTMKADVIIYLNSTFSKLSATFEILDLTPLPGRKRRNTEDGKKNMLALFVVYTFNSINYTTFQRLWNDRKDDEIFDDLSVIIAVDQSQSSIFSETEGTCSIPSLIDCDLSTTTCKYENGKQFCECKKGFEGFNIYHTSCSDINECAPGNEVCEGNCSNTLGSYTCTCQPGFQYDGIRQCTDLCKPNPCMNDGQCIHGEQENQYLCKCKDNWAGQNCDEENQETKKLKTIAIAVGSVFGAGCLLLLCVVFGMYRRNKAMNGDFYTRRPLSMDFDDSRYDLRATSIPMRKDDFPIDDDTSTAFSIPRPAVSTTNAYDPVGQKSAYDLLEEQEAAKVGEAKPLTEEGRPEGEELGKENPSFVHSEASASSTRRASKSPYEYF